MTKFHPLIHTWFTETYGEPTDIQQQAWPVIAKGGHVLVTAPTGCGKTLTAFMWALNRLVTGTWDGSGIKVLYVSPLKALNTDIRQNLLEPLNTLKARFSLEDAPFREVNVLTRSGDTPQKDRRRMITRPPEILITTPESLNLILSGTHAARIFGNLKCVIMDEVHAVVGSRRGTHLITGVERLVEFAGEFQRIALSATVAPLEQVAAFIGGSKLVYDDEIPLYRPRPVTILNSGSGSKQYDIRIRFPEKGEGAAGARTYWDGVAAGCRAVMEHNRSTLIFVNNRALAEKLTFLINTVYPEPVACAHHGSLSREVRTAVEERFKAGKLKAIVATSSLEMGIDIGELDEVVLIQAPLSVSSAIQRIGRAGHRVGEVSRCTIFPSHAADVLLNTVLAKCVKEHDIEAVAIPEAPLDILAQIIISLCAYAPRSIDGLYDLLQTAWPYRNLARERFDGIIDMLGGRYAKTRIRELKPRVIIDTDAGTVLARRGAVLALYAAGGTIPDRGYYRIRHMQTRQVIGELDEEYVWERRTGDRMTFGNRNWTIKEITHNDVLVLPTGTTGLAAPFWKNEENLRDSHFAARIASFLTEMQETPVLLHKDVLEAEWGLDENAAAALSALLGRQVTATGAPLPHAGHVLVEHIATGPGAVPGATQVVLHTMWGGRINRPFALALAAAWEIEFDQQLELFAGNEAIVLQMPRDIDDEQLVELVTADSLGNLLRQRLEGSGYFGARFRECSGRALLVTRRMPRERLPLWMNRLRSQKLLKAVLEYEDFPVLLEAWRTCLQDEFDLDGLREKLHALETGELQWTAVHTSAPSPLAADLAWKQINEYMYMDDSLAGAGPSEAGKTLLEEVAASDALRPPVPQDIVEQFTAKRQRTAPGYAPADADELLGWVHERRFIPVTEWDALQDAIRRDYPELAMDADDPRIVRTVSPYTGTELICGKTDRDAVDSLYAEREPAEGMEIDPAVLAGEWLSYQGPVAVKVAVARLGLPVERMAAFIDVLADEGQVVRGTLIAGSADEYVCDTENYETLLRMRRRAAVPVPHLLPARDIQPFLAEQQFAFAAAGEEGIFDALEILAGYGAPAGLWERELLPARVPGYRPDHLDTLIAENGVCWRGCGEQRVVFHAPDETGVLPEQSITETALTEEDVCKVLPGRGRFTFEQVSSAAGQTLNAFVPRFWQTAWDGRITADSFAPVRKGIENKFKPPTTLGTSNDSGKSTYSSRRRGFGAWKARQPSGGNWYAVTGPEDDIDPLSLHERKRERVRLLLDRYGILFRELLDREVPGFRWRDLFRTLRIMELGGEVVGSLFFEGASGPQYVRPRSIAVFRNGIPADRCYWMNAVDPASICGLGKDISGKRLPHRVDTAHIAFRGSEPMLVSRRQGKELMIYADPLDPGMPQFLEPLRHLLTRRVDPLKRIVIDTINKEDAGSSEYIGVLKTVFEVHTDFRCLEVYRLQSESVC